MARRSAARDFGGSAEAFAATGFDWFGLILISIILPAVLTPIIAHFFRKIGWIKEGDLTLEA